MKRWIILILFLLIAGPINMVMAQDISLKAKIGQMLIFGFKGMEIKEEDKITQSILKQEIGGVILFDYDFQTKTYDHNIQSPTQVKHLTQQLQAYTQEAAAEHRNHLYPLFVAIDYEGGKVNRLKETYGFPKTLSAEEIGKKTPKEAIKYADEMAATLKSVGININFAPLIDVNVNPDNPVIGKLGRSYSSDPEKVAEYAGIFSKAYQAEGILCAYKHFPGHGSSTGDTHTGFVDVTQTWKQEELIPYQDLLPKSYACPIVMTAHVQHYGLDSKGYPASISKGMTQDLLRDKLHFDGVVITDDMQMKAIADNYGTHEAVRLAINAGADMLIFGNQLSDTPQDPREIVDMIYADVKAGKISERRINEAYERIMKLKKKMQH